MSIAVPATNYLHCSSFQIPQSGGSILLWQTLRTHDETMFLTQKSLQSKPDRDGSKSQD